MSKYFIDTEFIEGTQKQKFPFNLFQKETKPTIDLISIGIVCEDNREYYAISKDFNLKEAWNRCQYNENFISGKNQQGKEYWIRENVLKPIYKELHNKENLYARQALYRAGVYIKETKFDFTYSNLKKLINKYGKTNKQIAEEVKKFCRHPNNLSSEITSPEFYGYYSDYDWVVFCWLFGRMIDLPNGFPMYCIDLKQEWDKLIQSNITVKLSDGEFHITNVKNLSKDYPKQTNTHNALSDAKWNFELYKFINKI